MKEQWKLISEIEEYKDFTMYAVSTEGRIKNIHTGKLRKLTPNRGYIELYMYNCNGKGKNIQIHRLVALAFIPNPDNLPQVNHKDEDTLNNNMRNLEWCTAGYNINYGTRNSKVSQTLSGRKRPKISGKNNNTSHAVVQLTLNDEFVQEFEYIKQVGENFNTTCISDCCRGIQKTHKGFKWVYKEDYEQTRL